MSAPVNSRDVLLQTTTPRFTNSGGTAGQDGLSSATVFIYQSNNSGVPPALPSVNATYTFNPPGLTGLNNGWSFTPPAASAGKYRFISRAVAASTSSTDVLASLDWSAAQLLAQDGADGTNGRDGSASFYPPLTDTGWTSGPGTTSIVAVSDGPSGATSRRTGAGQQVYLQHANLYTIDRSRIYRVRFYARASAAATGSLYFDLRQYLASGADTGAAGNYGRSPYKPGARAAADTRNWTLIDYTWSAADWQTGAMQVRPDFLLNYLEGGAVPAGYWEIQDFQMVDVTDVVAAQSAAETYALAQANLAKVTAQAYADGVVDAEEARAIADATAKAEAARVAAVNAAAADATAKASAAQTAAQNYAAAQANLADVSARAYADGVVDAEEARAISDAAAKAEAARVAAVNAAAADATAKANVAATTANWPNIVSKPTDAEIYNNQDSIIRAPGGALLVTTTELHTGCIKIRLPQWGTDTMLRFAVDIYEYVPNMSCTLEIAGYTYGAGLWYNVSAVVVGGSTGVEYPVRFGNDGTKCCVYIGDANTPWMYPQVRVRDVLAGYVNYSKAQWESGWQISISNLGAQNVSANCAILDTLPGSNWSKIPPTNGRPENNATVGAPAGTNVGSTPATTVEANAASGAAAGAALANPPVLNNVSPIDASITYGGGLKTIAVVTPTTSGGSGPFSYSYVFTYGDSGDIGVNLIKSSSGGNTDNVLTLKGYASGPGLVTTGTLSVTSRDTKGQLAIKVVDISVDSI